MRFTLTTTLTAVLTLAPFAGADTITWNRVLTTAGNWDDAENWDPEQVPGMGDDVFFDGPAISMGGHREINFQWDITVNSITVLGPTVGNTFRLIGPGNMLTVESGNIYMNGNTSNPNHSLEIRSALQIGDGETPVTDAVWTSYNTLNYGLYLSHPISAIADTHVHLTGVAEANTAIFTLGGDNSNYLGTFTVDSPIQVNLRLEHATNNNVLGGGSLVIDSPSNTSIRWHTAGTSSEIADIQIDSNVWIVSGSTDAVRTLDGVLSGSGDLNVNRFVTASTGFHGTLITTADNTHTGNVVIHGGAFRVDGAWTGAGNVTFNNALGALEGSGVLGLGFGNNVNVHRGGTTANTATLSPGTAGTVGTFTIGTDGNGNTVTFGRNGILSTDIEGANADQLIVYGDLNLSDNLNTIAFNALSNPTAEVYTLVTYTGDRTGEFTNVTGLPAGYELDYSVQGQINLERLNGPPPATYDAWAASNGVAGEPVDEDFDGDGVLNGIEFVIGGDPTDGNSLALLPTLTVNGDYLDFVFRRTSESAQYSPHAQFSSDLSGWTAAEAGVNGVLVTQDANHFGAGIDRVTVRIPRALADDGRFFVRLTVDIP